MTYSLREETLCRKGVLASPLYRKITGSMRPLNTTAQTPA
jgi:hypothetical protein